MCLSTFFSRDQAIARNPPINLLAGMCVLRVVKEHLFPAASSQLQPPHQLDSVLTTISAMFRASTEDNSRFDELFSSLRFVLMALFVSSVENIRQLVDVLIVHLRNEVPELIWLRDKD